MKIKIRKGDTEKELALINDNQRKFVCEYFKESYERGRV